MVLGTYTWLALSISLTQPLTETDAWKQFEMFADKGLVSSKSYVDAKLESLIAENSKDGLEVTFSNKILRITFDSSSKSMIRYSCIPPRSESLEGMTENELLDFARKAYYAAGYSRIPTVKNLPKASAGRYIETTSLSLSSEYKGVPYKGDVAISVNGRAKHLVSINCSSRFPDPIDEKPDGLSGEFAKSTAINKVISLSPIEIVEITVEPSLRIGRIDRWNVGQSFDFRTDQDLAYDQRGQYHILNVSFWETNVDGDRPAVWTVSLTPDGVRVLAAVRIPAAMMQPLGGSRTMAKPKERQEFVPTSLIVGQTTTPIKATKVDLDKTGPDKGRVVVKSGHQYASAKLVGPNTFVIKTKTGRQAWRFAEVK